MDSTLTWKDYFNKGIELGKYGRTIESIIEFKNAIKLAPNIPDPYGHLAWQYLYANQYENAIKMYLKLTEFQPDNAEAYYRMGDCYLELDDFTKAEDCYKISLNLSPLNADIIIRLSDLYYCIHDYNQAINYIDQAVEILPNVVFLEKRALCQKEWEIYKSLITNPFKSKSEIYQKALQYRNSKGWDLAINEYKTLLLLYPLDPDIYYEIGCTYMERIMPRYEKAFSYFEKIIYHHPDHMKSYLQRARCQAKLGFKKDAVESYLKYLSFQNANKSVYAELGNLYVGLLDYGKAIECYSMEQSINSYMNWNIAACYLKQDNKVEAGKHIGLGIKNSFNNPLGIFLDQINLEKPTSLPSDMFYLDDKIKSNKLTQFIKHFINKFIYTYKIIDCDLCRCNQYNIYTHNPHNGWTIVRCQKCGLVYVNPQPIFGKLEDIYDDQYMLARIEDSKWVFDQHIQGYSHNICMQTELNWLDSKGFSEFEENLPSTKACLDIGCASGVFLLGMESRGWQVQGTDISKTAVDHCRAQGLQVDKGTLESIHYPDNSFDFIIMNHVIEHVPNPSSTLKEIYRILKPNGCLFIKTPCCDSIPSFLAGTNWFMDPDHIYFFSKNTLCKLLEKEKFKIIATHCYVGVESETYPDYWKDNQISPLITKLINEHDLGDVIMIYAQKE